MQELKKRYSVEAKKNFKDFLKIQKRSKMIASKQGRFLIEFL